MINEEVKNSIKSDYLKGLIVSELSKKYDISYYKINKYLLINKLKRTNSYISNTTLDLLEKYIRLGYTIGDIGEELNISKETIRNYAIENDLEINKRRCRRHDKNIDFIDDYFEK